MGRDEASSASQYNTVKGYLIYYGKMHQIMTEMCAVHDGVCIKLDYVVQFSLPCYTIDHPTHVSSGVPHPNTFTLYYLIYIYITLYDACLQAVSFWRYGRAERPRVASSAAFC